MLGSTGTIKVLSTAGLNLYLAGLDQGFAEHRILSIPLTCTMTTRIFAGEQAPGVAAMDVAVAGRHMAVVRLDKGDPRRRGCPSAPAGVVCPAAGRRGGAPRT